MKIDSIEEDLDDFEEERKEIAQEQKKSDETSPVYQESKELKE